MKITLPDYKTYTIENALLMCPRKDLECIQAEESKGCKDCPFINKLNKII